MDRRGYVRLRLATDGAAALPRTQAAASPVIDAGVRHQQDLMAANKLTSHSLTSQYLARINTIDRAGPRINSILEINPEALKIAREMDRERLLRRVRGPLHGIPVLLKGNIATADRMNTTAGSLALAGMRAARDSHVAACLREAGAVIIGKTNLSEWSAMRSSHSASGWSARGGLTRNPYSLDRNCGGASCGSGAAIAAGLATLAVGTETDGSIVTPAAICGLVGIKPTIGLVSRSGIIPIAHLQDTAGPMARCVSDAALILAVMAGVDANDPVTRDGAGKAADYALALKRDGLRGKRLGVARNLFFGGDGVDAEIEKALAALAAQGAILVDVQVPNTEKYGGGETEVLLHEVKADLAACLRDYAPAARVRCMADLIAFNKQHTQLELPRFGQECVERAEAEPGQDCRAHRDAPANDRRCAREAGIDLVLRSHGLDALVAPTNGAAWLTDFIDGDRYPKSFSSPAAVAGHPHVTVPAGYARGLPVGLSFGGSAFSEAVLIGMAYAFEQATMLRRAPLFLPSASVEAR